MNVYDDTTERFYQVKKNIVVGKQKKQRLHSDLVLLFKYLRIKIVNIKHKQKRATNYYKFILTELYLRRAVITLDS